MSIALRHTGSTTSWLISLSSILLISILLQSITGLLNLSKYLAGSILPANVPFQATTIQTTHEIQFHSITYLHSSLDVPDIGFTLLIDSIQSQSRPLLESCSTTNFSRETADKHNQHNLHCLNSHLCLSYSNRHSIFTNTVSILPPILDLHLCTCILLASSMLCTLINLVCSTHIAYLGLLFLLYSFIELSYHTFPFSTSTHVSLSLFIISVHTTHLLVGIFLLQSNQIYSILVTSSCTSLVFTRYSYSYYHFVDFVWVFVYYLCYSLLFSVYYTRHCCT